MKRRPTLPAALAAACLLLSGCLEVEQYPPWRNSQYDGKPDNLQHQALFHHDRLAWMGTIINRNQLQNEYNRTRP
ncbi:MAG: hypothetical protein JWR60_3239 [Polaromonas sp.]|nr:hypothetical protein [Polaromonas sp.]